jgi:hypothetical protein
MATIEVQQVLLSKVSRTRRKTDIATTKPYALASFLFKVHEVLLVRPRIPHVASNHAARTTLRCSNRCRTEAVLTPGQNILHASFDTSGQPLEMPNATCILSACIDPTSALGPRRLPSALFADVTLETSSWARTGFTTGPSGGGRHCPWVGLFFEVGVELGPPRTAIVLSPSSGTALAHLDPTLLTNRTTARLASCERVPLRRPIV